MSKALGLGLVLHDIPTESSHFHLDSPAAFILSRIVCIAILLRFLMRSLVSIESFS